MSKRVSHRQATVALAAALVLCLGASLRELRHAFDYLASTRQIDFKNYYVASDLVRERLNSDLYDGIGSDDFFQRRSMNDSAVFATVARGQGIPHVQFYTSPPFLADALLPLTWLSVGTAAWAWRLLSLFAVAMSAGWLSCLLGYRFLSGPSLLLLAGLFCFAPLWQGLHYGQITMVLLALWCTGILLYVRGWKRASALVLALGVLLKMTPLLVVVPILIWRDWRWMRWFAGVVAVGALLMCCINAPGTVSFYLFHVVPLMSAGIAVGENKTVASAVGMLLGSGRMVVSHSAVLMGKLLSGALVAAAALLAYRAKSNGQERARAMVLSAFALLSLCVTPIAWLDSYIIGCILLALLWQRMLAGGRRPAELLLLFAATVAMGTSVGPGYLYWRLDQSILFQIAPVALAILLVLFALHTSGETGSGDAAERG